MCVCGLYEGVWVSEWVNEIEWHRKNEISINLIFDIHIKRLLFQSSITVCDLVRRLKSINARAHRKHYDWHEIGTIPIYTDTEMTGHSEVKSTYNFQLWHTDSAFATILWLFVCEIRYNFSLSLCFFPVSFVYDYFIRWPYCSSRNELWLQQRREKNVFIEQLCE